MRSAARWLAHAKVNLSLDVGPVRPDGYHPYVSYATSVGIADVLDFTFVTGEGSGAVAVETSTGLEDTLVTAAVRAVVRAAGRGDVDVAVVVDKRIPAGAGLGGGSADAAAALAATAAALGGGIDLGPLAVALGTDVPFCLAGGCARLHGRGELVDPLAPLPAFGVLVVVPPLHVPTAAAFAELDRAGAGVDAADGEATPEWIAELLPGCTFRNDLEAATVRVVPELAWWRDAIAAVAGRAPVMTGSGAGFVLLARTAAELQPLAAQVAELGARVWVTTPVPHGPVRA